MDQKKDVIEYLDDDRWRLNPTTGFQQPIVITAKRLAMVSTKRKNSRHWVELHAFETMSGRGVVVEAKRILDDTRPDYCSVIITDAVADIPSEISYSPLARKLFNEMGLSEIRID